jgi:branched-subunit amino acid ABC-type transport system permease component
MGIWAGTVFIFGIYNFLWIQYQTRSFFSGDLELIYLGTSLFILYAFAYALFSIWLQRRWLSRITPKLASLFFVLLTVLPYILIQILSLIVTQDDIDSDIPLPGVILDLFNIFDHHSSYGDHLYYHLAAVLVMIGFGLLLNLKWIQSQISQFTPFTKPTTILPPPSQPEPHAGEPPPVIS